MYLWPLSFITHKHVRLWIYALQLVYKSYKSFSSQKKNTMYYHCVYCIFHCVVIYFSLYTDIPLYVKSINVQAGGPILRQGTESEVCCYKLQKCYKVIEKINTKPAFDFRKDVLLETLLLGILNKWQIRNGPQKWTDIILIRRQFIN